MRIIVSKKDWQGGFLFSQIIKSEVLSFFSAQVDRNETDTPHQSNEPNQGFSSNGPAPQRQSLCRKLWTALKESHLCDGVNTALGVGPILFSPTVTVLDFIQWSTKKTTSLPFCSTRYVYFLLPFSFPRPSVIGPQPQYSDKPYLTKQH